MNQLLLLCVACSQLAVAQINRDEEVHFTGPYLYWCDSDTLEMVLRGRFVEPEKTGIGRRVTIDRVISPALFRYMGKKPSDFDQESRDLMVSRLLPFLADGESRESLKMRVIGRGGAATIVVPKTDAGGTFTLVTRTAGELNLRDLAASGDDLQVHAVVPDSDKRRFAVRLAVPRRDAKLLVVSDVDDTVRIAEVLDRPRMIERVFLRHYEPVPGLADVYRQLAMASGGVHFVSGSPWQIAPVIEEFLTAERFPPAVLHCRQMSWDFWNSDPIHTKDFKVATIKTLLKQFPTPKFLLIGDDGEHDPEVYTEICRSDPARVAGVWIRQVRREPPIERLAEAKRILGAERVLSFRDAAQLEPVVADIVAP
jgi:hypothetical protein